MGDFDFWNRCWSICLGLLRDKSAPSGLVLVKYREKDTKPRRDSGTDLTPQVGQTTKSKSIRKQTKKEHLRVKSPALDELLWALVSIRVGDCSHLFPLSVPAFVLLLLLEELSQVSAPKIQKTTWQRKMNRECWEKNGTRPFLLVPVSCKNGLFHQSET